MNAVNFKNALIESILNFKKKKKGQRKCLQTVGFKARILPKLLLQYQQATVRRLEQSALHPTATHMV